jgi:hypothetical protein
LVDLRKLDAEREAAEAYAEQLALYRATWRGRFYGNLPVVLVLMVVSVVAVGLRLVLQGYRLEQLTGQLLILAGAALIWGLFLSIVDARYDFENALLGRKSPIELEFVGQVVLGFVLLGMTLYAIGLQLTIQPYNQRLVLTDSAWRWAIIAVIDGVVFGLTIAGAVAEQHQPQLANRYVSVILLSVLLIGFLAGLATLGHRSSVIWVPILSFMWIQYYWPQRKDFALLDS